MLYFIHRCHEKKIVKVGYHLMGFLMHVLNRTKQKCRQEIGMEESLNKQHAINAMSPYVVLLTSCHSL